MLAGMLAQTRLDMVGGSRDGRKQRPPLTAACKTHETKRKRNEERKRAWTRWARRRQRARQQREEKEGKHGAEGQEKLRGPPAPN